MMAMGIALICQKNWHLAVSVWAIYVLIAVRR
jgi:hypothetical protein